MQFLILGPSSLPIVVAQLGERHAKEQLLCWSGMTDTVHITFGSNEEFVYYNCLSTSTESLKIRPIRIQ